MTYELRTLVFGRPLSQIAWRWLEFTCDLGKSHSPESYRKPFDKMSVENRAKAFEKRFPGDSYKMYVAEAAGRGVVGFADFGEPRESLDAYEAELYAIYLLPEFQGEGVGGGLFSLGTCLT